MNRLARHTVAAVCALAALLLAGLAAGPASAGAAEPTAAWWHMTMTTVPSNIKPGEEATLSVIASNIGDAPVNVGGKEAIVLKVALPANLETVGTSAPFTCVNFFTPTIPVCGTRLPKRTFFEGEEEKAREEAEAAQEKKEKEEGKPGIAPYPPIVQCKQVGGREAVCELPRELVPFESLEVSMRVKVSAGAPASESEIVSSSVSGGGIAGASLTRHVKISDEETSFGSESFEFEPENELGGIESQAGAHPFQATTDLQFNRVLHLFSNGKEEPSTPGIVRNIHVNLPPGFIGNPRVDSFKECSNLDFATLRPNNAANECPGDSAIGVAITSLNEPHNLHDLTVASPLFNLEPAKGDPARFGFVAEGVPVTLEAIDKGGDFHVVVGVNNASADPAILGSLVTIWGTPSDARHEASRGTNCLAQGYDAIEGESHPKCKTEKEEEEEQKVTVGSQPFLTNPTSCEELRTSVDLQSWSSGAFVEGGEGLSSPAITGCSALPFAPSITIQPDETSSNTPTGLNVTLKVPQETLSEPGALAEANIRNTVVTLPAGMQLSPSAADGLESCSLHQIGWKGTNPHTGTQEFLPEEAKLESEETEAERATKCPKASKVGTVEVKTPVLKDPLKGNVYLAAQEENPFGSLFGIYIVIKDPTTGIVAKLAGEVQLNKTTGQVTTNFDNAPQLPFEELKLSLTNGPRASLATPRACGSYASSAGFTSWAGGSEVGSAAGSEPLGFTISSGPEGSACASPQPFAPLFSAGMEQQQAGAFSNFDLTLIRNSSEQAVNGLTVKLPPGMAAMLSNVERCPEPAASEGTCGPGSLIGSATAQSGLGEDPYTIGGGRVYITGPYGGAPFGLSVVIPAEAGGTPGHPVFHFGNVITRSALFVDPTTAAVTIVSQLPTMVETHEKGAIGVPVQLRRVDVHVERPEFQFNPTNCSPMSITGTVTGDEGASTNVSEPFQVTGCEKLAFSPELTAEVESNWTKVEGTGLKVIVKATPGQANIHKTKIVFPSQMPSRLTTIQKACPEATFNANPATCPEGSNIGSAIAHTPVLKNPLVGPAYLVSHGNAAFPDAEFVLQGEGVKLVLDGKTDIKGPHGEPCAQSKEGCITSSTFESVPDAPVSTFEVTLPRGPHSAFTGYGELCHATKTVAETKTVTKTVGKGKKKHKVKVKEKVNVAVAESLTLPTILGGQNGNTIEETLPLKVTGCHEVKASKVTKKPTKKKSKKKKKKKKK
jgi:hypothetical protein